jgi:hypothetical protein
VTGYKKVPKKITGKLRGHPAFFGSVESEDDIFSNSKSDSSSDGRCYANEDTDGYPYIVAYCNVTDDPHFWDAFMGGA